MIRKILGWGLMIAIGWGVITWLAEPGNGRELGRTSGEIAVTGGEAVGGAGDGVTAFFRQLSK